MKKLTITIALLTGLFTGISFASQYDKPGFFTKVEDGRLWVFYSGSEQLKEFKAHGEPAKQYTAVGGGPEGMTVKSGDKKALKDYLSRVKK